MFRSSPPEVFSKKDVAEIRSKPTGEQPQRSVITPKPLCNFIEITPTHRCALENPKCTRKTPLLRRTPLGDCSCLPEDKRILKKRCQKSFKKYKL